MEATNSPDKAGNSPDNSPDNLPKVTKDLKNENQDSNGNGSEIKPNSPTCVLFIGMAASGKTSLMQRLASHLKSKYTINLDPAVKSTPYKCNIDIRDTVSFQKVMQEYRLGPNGAILTCLNLFTTKWDQVLDLLAQKDKKWVLIDTPGQIEIFTWSASGQIISDSLASMFPSVVLYVVDTPRSVSPTTFMSNMLYACSILYKTRLPFILVFNKTDVVDMDFCAEWMTDFEQFQLALEDDVTYMGTLVSSMCLFCGVSAVTGEGIDSLEALIEECKQEWTLEYKPYIEKKAAKNREKNIKARREGLDKLISDLSIDGFLLYLILEQ